MTHIWGITILHGVITISFIARITATIGAIHGQVAAVGPGIPAVLPAVHGAAVQVATTTVSTIQVRAEVLSIVQLRPTDNPAVMAQEPQPLMEVAAAAVEVHITDKVPAVAVPAAPAVQEHITGPVLQVIHPVHLPVAVVA